MGDKSKIMKIKSDKTHKDEKQDKALISKMIKTQTAGGMNQGLSKKAKKY